MLEMLCTQHIFIAKQLVEYDQILLQLAHILFMIVIHSKMDKLCGRHGARVDARYDLSNRYN